MTPLNAYAGELGATSRGAASISITVPPHLQASFSQYRTGQSSPVCVRAKGLTIKYHIALAREDGVDSNRGETGITALSNERACDGKPIGAMGGKSEIAVQPAATNAAGPTMLLIIPE
jgi:hypothetical protein